MNLYWKFVYSYGKLIGGAMMFVGILYAISGLALYIVGAIPGLLFTWLGWKIFKTAKHHEEHAKNNHTVADDKKTRIRKRIFGIFVTGVVALAFALFVLLVFLIYELIQYKP